MLSYFVHIWLTLVPSLVSNSVLGTLMSSENILFIHLWKMYKKFVSKLINTVNIKIPNLNYFSKTTHCLVKWQLLWHVSGFLSHRHVKFFLTRTEGLRTEDVVHCTACKAQWGNVIVILGYINKIDLIRFELIWISLQVFLLILQFCYFWVLPPPKMLHTVKWNSDRGIL